MRSAIIIAVGATVAAATNPALNKRDADECTSRAMAFLPEITGLPSPTGSLLSFLATETKLATYTGSCDFPRITGAMAKEYTSFVEDLSSWYKDHKSDVSEIMAACSDVPEVKSQIDELKGYGAMCSEITWEGAKESEAAKSDSDSDKDGDSKDSEKKDGDSGAGLNSIKAGIVVAVAGLTGVMML
ncbi:hypothetical protein NW752_002489 [Fusarium irregulare]|uniref:Infection structure specific protein n=1 Tax=Fusarium irregulare TaxID=2494466 RepID=A0A9W8PDP3_9HYPO|nr:hypothetical protein NW766_012816 [Fusarium irregulare]KAJ4025031.1 hypothetical protein NW752_002489 [Fusarium irregulare]